MKVFSVGENKKTCNFFLTVSIVLLSCGITFGSLYLSKSSSETLDSIKTYISNFFSTFGENTNNLNVFKNSLIEGIIYFVIIFFMGFFRFGFAVTGAIIIKKGFVTGYTAASFIKLYGINGLLVMLSTMPSVFIAIPAMLFFATVSVIFSLSGGKKDKKMIISYIFLLFLMIAIFCISSLAEGYLTTTFMKLISSKLV